MSKMFTHDLSYLEDEATYWLQVFEQMSDADFKGVAPGKWALRRIKDFARAYQPLEVLKGDEGMILN